MDRSKELSRRSEHQVKSFYGWRKLTEDSLVFAWSCVMGRTKPLKIVPNGWTYGTLKNNKEKRIVGMDYRVLFFCIFVSKANMRSRVRQIKLCWCWKHICRDCYWSAEKVLLAPASPLSKPSFKGISLSAILNTFRDGFKTKDLKERHFFSYCWILRILYIF